MHWPEQPAAADPRGGWLALGASTGGPAALRDLLAELPAPPPLRVVIVQHIAGGFELDLADWLAGCLSLDVRVALDGERPRPGTVRLAPGGAHLRVSAGDRLALDAATPPRHGHRPSVDELFFSLAVVAPRETAAALLDGMGSDGGEGLKALRRAGAFCLAQDEAGCDRCQLRQVPPDCRRSRVRSMHRRPSCRVCPVPCATYLRATMEDGTWSRSLLAPSRVDTSSGLDHV